MRRKKKYGEIKKKKNVPRNTRYVRRYFRNVCTLSKSNMEEYLFGAIQNMPEITKIRWRMMNVKTN